MERVRTQSVNRLVNQKMFPLMKSSMITTKGMLMVSKIDIQTQLSGKQISTNYQPCLKNAPIQPIRYLRASSTRLSLLDKQTKPKQTSYYNNNNPTLISNLLDKSKVSNRGYGIVKAYSVNSTFLNCNTRISIITNLTKTSIATRQILFFGMYEGHNGLGYAQYLKQHYHSLLSEQSILQKDPIQAIKRAKYQLDKNFAIDIKYNDHSSAGISIVLIKDSRAFFGYNATTRTVVSKNLGANIFTPSDHEEQTSQIRKSGESVYRNYGLLTDFKIQVNLVSLELDGTMDAIIIGSEGLFEGNKSEEFGQLMWNLVLKNTNFKMIHFVAGQVVSGMLTEAMNRTNKKDGSIILIFFQNIAQCLKQDQVIKIPHLPQK